MDRIVTSIEQQIDELQKQQQIYNLLHRDMSNISRSMSGADEEHKGNILHDIETLDASIMKEKEIYALLYDRLHGEKKEESQGGRDGGVKTGDNDEGDLLDSRISNLQRQIAVMHGRLSTIDQPHQDNVVSSGIKETGEKIIGGRKTGGKAGSGSWSSVKKQVVRSEIKEERPEKGKIDKNGNKSIEKYRREIDVLMERKNVLLKKNKQLKNACRTVVKEVEMLDSIYNENRALYNTYRSLYTSLGYDDSSVRVDYDDERVKQIVSYSSMLNNVV